jgi:hypothetical protein
LHFDQAAEFIGNREFRPELDSRRFNYAKWAQLNRPVVREYASPSAPTYGIILDASQDDDTSQVVHASELRSRQEVISEAMVSLAASISDAIAKSEGHLLFVAVGGHICDLRTLAPSFVHQRVLQELAIASPATPLDRGNLLRSLRRSIETPQQLLVLTSEHASSLADALRPALPLELHCQPIVIRPHEAHLDPGSNNRVAVSVAEIVSGQVTLR